MKTVAALFAVLLSAQVAADCSDVNVEPVDPNDFEGAENGVQKSSGDTLRHLERRQAFLNCLKPAPFVQEPIVIELDEIADDFNGRSALRLERAAARVAAS
jgi:hypothetical protein